MEGGTGRVKSIYVYPIKSCRGISVSQAPLTPTVKHTHTGSNSRHPVKGAREIPLDKPRGFRWDRQWLVVNSNGRAYTQRVAPKLALVDIELPSDAFTEGWKPTNNSYMVIKAPGMAELNISLSKPNGTADGVSVWEWSGSALDEGAEASKWFSDYLGKSSRLVRFNEESETRMVDPNYACGHKIMFSDGYPFLLLSQGSLDALNKLLKQPVPVNRFRPNILVDGCEPYSEDLWKEMTINKLAFHGVKLCSRCKVPTINQDDATAGPEPTETLMNFRSDKVLRPTQKSQGKVYFGQNLVCKESITVGKRMSVKVGDPVYVQRLYSSCADAAA